MLYQKGSTILNEIRDQPRLWGELLEKLGARRGELGAELRSKNFGQVVYVGCGPSYHTGLSAARITHLVSGLTSAAVPASEVLYARRPPYDVRIKTLVVALSRSGDTSETVWAAEKLRSLDPRATLLALTASEGGELLQHAHQHLPLEGTQEEGAVATRSQSAALLATMVLVAWLSAREAFWKELTRLPEVLDIGRLRDDVLPISTKLKPQFAAFLGSGPYLGAAAEGALKLREMAAIPAEYQHLLEYPHGSHCALNNLMMVVGLVSDTFRSAEEQCLADLAVMRTPRVLITEKADEKVKMRLEHVVELKSGVSEVSRVLLMLPVLQLLAYEFALARGTNPDRPRQLSQVVRLKQKPGG